MKATGMTDVAVHESEGESHMEESYFVEFTPVNQRPPLNVLDPNLLSQQRNEQADNVAKASKVSEASKKRRLKSDPKALAKAKKPRIGSGPMHTNMTKQDRDIDNETILSVFRLSKDDAVTASTGQEKSLAECAIRNEATNHQRLRLAKHRNSSNTEVLKPDRATYDVGNGRPALLSSDASSLDIPDMPPPIYLEDEREPHVNVDYVPPNSAQDPLDASQSGSDEFPFDEQDLIIGFTNTMSALGSESTLKEVADNYITPASPIVPMSDPMVVSETRIELTEDMEEFVQVSEEKENISAVDLEAFNEKELDTGTRPETASITKQSLPDKPGLTFLPPKLYMPSKSTPVGSKSSPTLIELEWASPKCTSIPLSRPRSSNKASSSSSITLPTYKKSVEKPPGESIDKKSRPLDKPQASHVITFDNNGNAIPFVRPPFPAPLRDRSPIPGLSSRTCLRTCFRVGEALNAFSAASRNSLDACTELYARVLSSHREGYKQFFRFGDLFSPVKPPFINGVFGLWRSNELWDTDSSPFLTSGELTKKMCRVVGRMKRNEKLEVEMVILSVWECSWEDVQVAKGVVCA